MSFFLSFFTSIFVLYLIRKSDFIKSFTQPQREIIKNAEIKAKSKPIPCGGIIFFGVYSIFTIIKGHIDYQYWILFGFFLIGFIDDAGKIIKKSHISFMNGKWRLITEFILSLVFAYFFTQNGYNITYKEYSISVPFFCVIPAIMLFITGTANAVNLTDGQDGLVGKIIIVHLFFLMLFGFNEIYTIIIATILGFLLFNSKPATIYMGDAGSLFLGAFVAIAFLNTKIEYLLPITGAVFVIEALSVITQVSYFKFTKRKYGEGKRIFKMAPFHHHLEICGISEEKITNLAFTITIITCFIAYLLIK